MGGKHLFQKYVHFLPSRRGILILSHGTCMPITNVRVIRVYFRHCDVHKKIFHPLNTFPITSLCLIGLFSLIPMSIVHFHVNGVNLSRQSRN